MKKNNKLKEDSINLLKKVKNLYYRYAPSESVVKRQYKKRLGRKVELVNPKLFTDKLQWLKLNWYDERATNMADKYAVHQVISQSVGDQYLNEVYGVYDCVDKIDISKLPKSFVLKGTHGSGYNFICKDKSKVDWEKQKRKMKSWLNDNYYWSKREWVYKDIKPRIVCEKFLSDDNLNSQGLVDFKFYCFDGVPHYCQVIQGRGGNETIDFYDMDWKHMPFTGMRLLPNSEEPLERPIDFNEMKSISEKLSKDFPFVRVDLYYVQNTIYFGELTFFPTSGMGQFDPSEWNEKMGELLRLPNKSKGLNK